MDRTDTRDRIVSKQNKEILIQVLAQDLAFSISYSSSQPPFSLSSTKSADTQLFKGEANRRAWKEIGPD